VAQSKVLVDPFLRKLLKEERKINPPSKKKVLGLV
jgi:hypothetical protein